MYKNILLFIVFSFLINWTISLQMLNQSSKEKSIKFIAIALALVMGTTAGFIISLIL